MLLHEQIQNKINKCIWSTFHILFCIIFRAFERFIF